MSCSSGENNFKNLRIPDDPEGDRQRQSGDGATSLPASQPEAGRGTQKKPQGKRRDQKSSEGLDMQGKPGSKGVILPSKRSPLPSKLQGEKGNNSSVRLRRNASSAGRLQGLSSGSSTGSLGRKESKISEANLPSKTRPKSLEFTISLGEREPLNPDILFPQEKIRSETLDSTATPSEVATLDVGAAVAPERGSRNSEHCVILPRNTLPNISLAKEEKTCEHPESIGPSEKNGIEGPETLQNLGEVVGSVLHEPSNPEILLFSGKKGPQNPEYLTSLRLVTFYPYCIYITTRSLSVLCSAQCFENLLEAVNPEKQNLCVHIFTKCHINSVSS